METLLLTAFDLRHSRRRPMMMRFESGQHALLQGSQEIVPDSLAQEDALAAGLPVVTVDGSDVAVLAHGGTVVLNTDDQRLEVEVRMMTADELIAKNGQARQAMLEQGLTERDLPPPISREKAVELTQTVR